MSKSLARNWQIIHDVLPGAVSIAWGECHKIYILMDEEAPGDDLVRVRPAAAHRPDRCRLGTFATLRRWWDESLLARRL